MAVGVELGNLGDGGMGEVVVVVVRDDDSVYDGDVFDLTGWLRVSLWTQPGEGGAAVGEDGIEEDAEPAGKFDVEAGMA